MERKEWLERDYKSPKVILNSIICEPPNLRMMNLIMKMVELKEITDNYKTDNKIASEIGNDIENVLDFNWNGEFRFIHCGSCGGPILGHKSVKYRVEQCEVWRRFDKGFWG